MNRLKLLICGALLGMIAFGASAAVIPVTNDGDGTDDPFTIVEGVPQQNFETVLREWLAGEILSYNNHNGPFAPLAPATQFTQKWEDPTTGFTVPVVSGDYLVLHYGRGNGGATPGGNLVALYATTDGSYSVPSLGSGPNGLGGISFVYLFDHTSGGPGGGPTVPDGGATLVLLGTALSGLGLLRRKLA